MANKEHLAILKQGIVSWNKWKAEHGDITVNFSKADLRGAHLVSAHLDEGMLSEVRLRRADLTRASLYKAYLAGADLTQVNLQNAHCVEADFSSAKLTKADMKGANFERASLSGANLDHADLKGARLNWVDLSWARLTSVDLSGAELYGADFTNADLSRANLSEARLERATMVRTNLRGANLTRSHVYGISAWDVELSGTDQSDLIITPQDAVTIQVDHLEVAQFLYLLLNNKKIRDVIDTVTSKVVLILGRFTPDRKVLLDAIRDKLRTQNYLPVLFDFEKSANRDLTETISTLAHMARFVIADITDAKSIPQELMKIVPALPSVPVQPLLLASQTEYSMFEHLQRFPWVLPPVFYDSQESLLTNLELKVIAPAESKAKDQTRG